MVVDGDSGSGGNGSDGGDFDTRKFNIHWLNTIIVANNMKFLILEDCLCDPSLRYLLGERGTTFFLQSLKVHILDWL